MLLFHDYCYYVVILLCYVIATVKFYQQCVCTFCQHFYVQLHAVEETVIANIEYAYQKNDYSLDGCFYVRHIDKYFY